MGAAGGVDRYGNTFQFIAISGIFGQMSTDQVLTEVAERWFGLRPEVTPELRAHVAAQLGAQ